MWLAIRQQLPGLGSTPHPLGPLLRRERSADPVKPRLIALVLLAVFFTPLCVAAFLPPDPSGIGTHRGLGYPACTFAIETGSPCPTCGMTTAFAQTVRGHWIQAFHAQPMGWLLAVAAIVGAGASIVSVVTGTSWRINWYRIPPLAAAVLMMVLAAMAWGYKVLFGSMGEVGYSF